MGQIVAGVALVIATNGIGSPILLALRVVMFQFEIYTDCARNGKGRCTIKVTTVGQDSDGLWGGTLSFSGSMESEMLFIGVDPIQSLISLVYLFCEYMVAYERKGGSLYTDSSYAEETRISASMWNDLLMSQFSGDLR